MKALRYLVYGLGGIVALVAIALVAALVVVDGAFVKSRLEQAMKEKNRVLRIEGEPKLSLFPKLGLALGKTTLSERSSEREFLSLESLSVSVGVVALASRQIAVDAISLAGLRVNVVRAKDGRLNFSDLAAAPANRLEEAQERERAPPRVVIAEVKIERAQLAYRDEKTGQEVRISDLDLRTGRLQDDTPSDIYFSAHITGKRPEADLRAELKGAASLNLARRTFALANLDGRVKGSAGAVRALDAQLRGSLAANAERGELKASDFSLAAKGAYERDAFDLALAAPQLAITPGKAAGAAVTADLKVKGPSRNVDARFRLEGLEGSAEALSIAALALSLDAAIAPNALKGRISTPVKGNLKAGSWELPKIAADLTITSPSIPQRTVTVPIRASAKANLAKQSAAAELTTKFDESTIQAKLGATRLEPLVATFDLKVDRLNVDKYLPPPKKESDPNAPIDLSALKGPTLNGRAEIGALTARRVKLADLRAEIRLANGKLEVAPHSASLYGGTLAGSLTADANGNRIALKETLQNVQMGPLLRDAAEQDRLEGRGTVDFQVAGAGASVAALKKSLAGTARIDLRDGAVKGINLAEAIQNVKSVIGGKSAKANDPSKRTDFSEITGSFVIRNGVARNEDLQGKAPLLRLAGAGDVDIGNSTLNYAARVSLVATSKGQGGRDLAHLAGVTVPVKLTGALEKPDVTIDFAEALAKSGGGVTRILESAGGAAGGAAGDIGRKLKGLLGR